MTTYAEIEAARQKAIRARVALVPKGCCHFCDLRIGARGALWCSQACAEDYAKERDELLPNTLRFNVLKGDKAVEIFSTHRSDKKDDGPVQMITAGMLGYYQRLDQLAHQVMAPADLEQIREA
jgi:hypothetical protein